jgi:hypothetical protein
MALSIKKANNSALEFISPKLIFEHVRVTYKAIKYISNDLFKNFTSNYNSPSLFVSTFGVEVPIPIVISDSSNLIIK